MIPNGLPGLLFAFEGLDGGGKSKAIALVADYLRSNPFCIRGRVDLGGNLISPEFLQSVEVIKTKEPGKDRLWGGLIYEELSKPEGVHTSNPKGFQRWYAVDSRENSKTIIVPNLKVGNIVVSDRYRPSLVYGAMDENDIRELMVINEGIIGPHFIWPDAVIIFDVSVDTALERLAKKGRELDEHEKRPILERVRKMYLAFARMYPNCHVVNGERSPEEVLEDVLSIILPIIRAKGLVQRT